jgi:hypothetical protein
VSYTLLPHFKSTLNCSIASFSTDNWALWTLRFVHLPFITRLRVPNRFVATIAIAHLEELRGDPTWTGAARYCSYVFFDPHRAVRGILLCFWKQVVRDWVTFRSVLLYIFGNNYEASLAYVLLPWPKLFLLCTLSWYLYQAVALHTLMYCVV